MPDCGRWTAPTTTGHSGTELGIKHTAHPLGSVCRLRVQAGGRMWWTWWCSYSGVGGRFDVGMSLVCVCSGLVGAL